MGEVRERSKQACVIETVDRRPALELPELPVEASAAEEAGCLGYAQMPGLASRNLAKKLTKSTMSPESLEIRSGVFFTLAWVL